MISHALRSAALALVLAALAACGSGSGGGSGGTPNVYVNGRVMKGTVTGGTVEARTPGGQVVGTASLGSDGFFTLTGHTGSDGVLIFTVAGSGATTVCDVFPRCGTNTAFGSAMPYGGGLSAAVYVHVNTTGSVSDFAFLNTISTLAARRLLVFSPSPTQASLQTVNLDLQAQLKLLAQDFIGAGNGLAPEVTTPSSLRLVDLSSATSLASISNDNDRGDLMRLSLLNAAFMGLLEPGVVPQSVPDLQAALDTVMQRYVNTGVLAGGDASLADGRALMRAYRAHLTALRQRTPAGAPVDTLISTMNSYLLTDNVKLGKIVRQMNAAEAVYSASALTSKHSGSIDSIDTDADGVSDLAEGALGYSAASAASSPCGAGAATGAVAFTPGSRNARIAFIDRSSKGLSGREGALPAGAPLAGIDGPPDVVACEATSTGAGASACSYVGGCTYLRQSSDATTQVFSALTGAKLDEFMLTSTPLPCPPSITILNGQCPSLSLNGVVSGSAIVARLRTDGFLLP